MTKGVVGAEKVRGTWVGSDIFVRHIFRYIYFVSDIFRRVVV